MARQRMLNPAFFVDEEVARLSFPARLLFQGLWTLADKRGRLEDRPVRIRAQVMPYDGVDAEALLSELADSGFILRYESAGKKVIQVRSFEKHQRPHPKEPDSALPAPPGPAVKKRGRPRKAVYVCPESESIPSGSSGSSESESEVPAGAPAVAVAVVDWNREAADAYLRRFPKGAAPGAMFRALKPLVRKHGWSEVSSELEAYLDQTEIRFHNWPKFAAGFGEWTSNGNSTGLVPARASPQGGRKLRDLAESSRMFLESLEGEGGAGPEGV